MVALKFVSLLAVLSSASAQTAPNWGQCGGNEWAGPTLCSAGLACSSANLWFSQCLPTPKPASTTLQTSTTKLTTKTTATTIKSTTTARTRSTTSAQTTTTKAPVVIAEPWAKCGGIGYTGPTGCPYAYYCFVHNIYVSQCLPDPNVSTTTKSTTTTTTASVAPKETYNYLFAFGDSYSQTGFDLAGTKPAVGNQLGNPAFPGWTTSGGANWIGYLLQSNAQLLAYNLASGGATTDASLVTPYAPTVLSFIDQVAQFTANLAPAPAYAPWKASDSLFAIWIGVNDVGNAWYTSDWPTRSQLIINKYFEQVQLLYNAGARKFVFVSVPPIERAPVNILTADAGSLLAIKNAVLHYNALLTVARNAFVATNPGVFAPFIDVVPKFNIVLDKPTVYGAANATCENLDGVSCLWWNDYHPGLVLQNGVADDIAIIVGLYL